MNFSIFPLLLAFQIIHMLNSLSHKFLSPAHVYKVLLNFSFLVWIISIIFLSSIVFPLCHPLSVFSIPTDFFFADMLLLLNFPLVFVFS